jgi:hypothetical protein
MGEIASYMLLRPLMLAWSLGFFLGLGWVLASDPSGSCLDDQPGVVRYERQPARR